MDVSIGTYIMVYCILTDISLSSIIGTSSKRTFSYKLLDSIKLKTIYCIT